jgi:hypothetical protein
MRRQGDVAVSDADLTVDLRALLVMAAEPAEPADSILAYFKARAGGTWSKHDLGKLQNALPEYNIKLRHIAGMTSLEWVGEHGGMSLLCAYTDRERSFVIDPDFLLDHNLAHFTARDARNAVRRALLSNPEQLAQAQHDIDAWKFAKVVLDEARARMAHAWFGYGMPLSQDQYGLERLCDPREDKR